MPSDAEQLTESEGVPIYRAEKALQQEEGNYEDARQVLREAPVAVKCRFASADADIYGLVLLKLNIHPPSLQKINILVGNERGIGNVKLSLGIREFSDAIDRLEREKGKMSALSQELGEGIQREFSPPESEWVELIRDRNELELQERMASRFADFLNEEELIMTVTLETGLIEGEADSSGSSDSNFVGDDEIDSVEFLCDVRVSPVRGEPVKVLSPGDPIFVTIKGGQDEHRRLINVIEKLTDEDVDMIPVPLSEIHRTQTGKLEFIVQFGENVTGRVIVGEDMNILTPRSVREAKSTSTDSVLPWVFLFLVLMLLGLAILYRLLL